VSVPGTHRIIASIVAIVFVSAATAHFVYVVPSKDAKGVQVVFSDSLDPDENVAIDKVKSLKMTARSADGKESAVEHKVAEHALVATVPAQTRVVYGSVTYGLLTRKDVKPALLIYHPKAILSACEAKTATVGEKAAIEIVPVIEAGKTAFLVLVAGKPVADVELSVLLPDGSKAKLKTDAKGQTEATKATGRHAIWARHTEAKAGEIDGKKYEEVRHYATLVIDVK
jgi:uncharacterized GH25 family protein